MGDELVAIRGARGRVQRLPGINPEDADRPSSAARTS